MLHKLKVKLTSLLRSCSTKTDSFAEVLMLLTLDALLKLLTT